MSLGDDCISLEGLKVDCIVGVYPHERQTPQRLIVDVQLFLDTSHAARSERLEDSLDYELVCGELAFLLKSAEFRLLETAVHALCRTLLLPPVEPLQRRAVDAVRLKLRKPAALGSKAIPSLSVTRRANQQQFLREEKSFGTVDVIHESADFGVYRLNIAPGATLPAHVHHQMHESELVLGPQLECQGRPAARGSVRRWPQGLTHGYFNPSDTWQSILCVDRPPFIETDEVPSDAAFGAISVLDAWTM